jgi:hypothetical protein
MQPVRTLLILFLLLLITSCAWIGRDYYFDTVNNSVIWQKKFQEGRSADKNGEHSDTVVFTYSMKEASIKINIDYQDVTVFAPVIIPMIPLPWQHSGKLHMEVIIEARESLNFDINDWRIINLDNNLEYKPEWVNASMPATLENNDSKKLFVQFPVEAVEISNLKLVFGPFIGSTAKTMPSPLTLKKIKGDWHYNQFTL